MEWAAAKHELPVVLQRGRTRESAEITVCPGEAMHSQKLQRGRTRESAEMGRTRVGWRRLEGGFNGAALVRVRRCGNGLKTDADYKASTGPHS